MNGLIIDYMYITTAKVLLLWVKIGPKRGQKRVVLGPMYERVLALMWNNHWQQSKRIWKNQRCGL